MKKKLALILVLVLCVAILFTFVACKKPVDDNTDPVATITEAEATTAMNAIQELAERWLLNNAEDTYTDRSADLKTAVSDLATVGTVVPNSFRVTPSNDNASYTIIAKWGSLEKSITIDNVCNNWGDGKVGKEYLADEEGDTVEEVILGVYDAFMATIDDAKAKGESFLDDGIGFNAKAYLTAGYGVDHENIDVALQVKGNIGTTDEDTDVAIELLANDEVAYGLYFDGAAAKEDCKIYVCAGDNYLYLDYANVVGIITDLVGYEPTAAAEEEIDSLEDLFGEDMVGILEVVFLVLFPNGGVITTDGDVTTYQLMVDLGELIGGVQGLLVGELADPINDIIQNLLPPPLNQLDLSSVEGIAGQLVLTVVTENDLVTDAEINLNIPERDFRFSATDEVSKMYGPLNFAFGVEGFNLAEQTDIIPTGDAIDDAEYFSPLNFNFSGDVTVKAVDTSEETDETLVDSVFSFELLTDINPFNLDAAKGSFIITETPNGSTEAVNFITITYDQSTGDGYYIFKDEDFYYIDTQVLYNYIDFYYADSIEDFVENIINDILGLDDEEEPEALVVEEEPEGEEGGINLDAIMSAVGDIQAWYDALVDDNKVVLDIDKADLLNSDIEVSLVTADINAILAIVNNTGLIPVTIPTLTQPESIEVLFNGEDSEDVFYVNVTVEGKEYVLEIDGSDWDANKTVTASFSVDALDYVRVTIVYDDASTDEIKVVDAAQKYKVTITVEVLEDEEAETPAYMTFELDTYITENAAGTLNGFQFTFTNDDSKEYTVYGEGVGIWTYDFSGIADFDFTFDNIPHYGFGYEDADFCLDVDLDGFYYNWGAANTTIDTTPEGTFEDKNNAACDIIDDIMDFLNIKPVVVS